MWLMVCMWSGILEGMLSEGGVASVIAAHQKLLRSSGLLSLSKCRAGEHLQASSIDHCACGLLDVICLVTGG